MPSLMVRASGLSVVLLLTATTSLRAQDTPTAKVVTSVGRLFGAGTGIDTIVVERNVVLRIRHGDSVLGFAQVRNVKGKDQPITVLIAVDPLARLKDVDVLVYREPYGGEVAYESWRRQFRGKAAADSLRVGREIRSISGATISVNAVTGAVRKTLADFSRWQGAGLLR